MSDLNREVVQWEDPWADSARARLHQALALVDDRRAPSTLGGSDLLAAKVLCEAAGKPVKKIVQMDGHRPPAPGDPFVYPDDDGDCLLGGNTIELCRSLSLDMPVRVFIHPGAQKEDVLRLLEKIRDWVQQDGVDAIREFRWEEADDADV